MVLDIETHSIRPFDDFDNPHFQKLVADEMALLQGKPQETANVFNGRGSGFLMIQNPDCRNKEMRMMVGFYGFHCMPFLDIEM